MTSRSGLSTTTPFRSFSVLASLAAIGLGIMALVGNLLGLGIVTRGSLSFLSSVENTASATFILAGISLWLRRKEEVEEPRRKIAQLCASLVFCVGLFTLVEYSFGWDLMIGGAIRISSTTALNFFILGLALLFLDVETRRGHRPTEFFILTAFLVCLLAFLGYAYEVKPFFLFGFYLHEALPTGFLFLLFYLAIFLSRPNRGLMAILTSRSMVGFLARRLVPGVIGIPILLGWLKLQSHRAGLYDTELGLSLILMLNVVIFIGLVWWSAEILHQMEMERRRTEDELKKTQAELVQAEKSTLVNQLAAGVAHEVKNPLAILLQGVDYLAKHGGNGDPNLPTVLTDMAEAVKRADNLTEGLLDLTRPTQLILGPEDLNDIIESSLWLVKNELDRHHIQIIKSLKSDFPRISVDRGKVVQVFINLFMNARDAMPQGGQLTIKTYAKRSFAEESTPMIRRKNMTSDLAEGLAVVEIEDSGHGIPNEILPRIFDPFVTTKRARGGTGLGLSIVKNIMEMHRGQIEIKNKKEGGVRASLTFPILLSLK